MIRWLAWLRPDELPRLFRRRLGGGQAQAFAHARVDDVALVRELGRDSLARCERGRLVTLERAGHWVLHEEPERAAAAILDFLSEAGPARVRRAIPDVATPDGTPPDGTRFLADRSKAG